MHGSFAKVRTYVVPEICSRADRQTDRETDRQTRSSQYLPPVIEVEINGTATTTRRDTYLYMYMGEVLFLGVWFLGCGG